MNPVHEHRWGYPWRLCPGGLVLYELVQKQEQFPHIYAVRNFLQHVEFHNLHQEVT